MADTTSNQGPTTTLGNFLFTANNPQNTGISDVLSNMSDMQKLNGQFAVNKAIATAGYKKDSKGNLIKYSLDTSGNPVIDPNGQPIIDAAGIADSLNKQGFGNLIDPTLQALSNARITNSTNQAGLNQILAGQKAAGIAVGQGTAFKPTIATSATPAGTPSTPAGTPSYTPPASSDNSTSAPSNAPTNAPTPSGIDLSKYSDGDLMILSRKDPATFRAIQAQIGTTVDGKFGNKTLQAFRQAKAQNMTPTPANIAAAYGSNAGDNANGQVQPENTVQVTPPASSDNSGTFTLPDISTSEPSSAPAPLAMGSQVGFGGVAPGTFQGSYPTPSQNIPKSSPGTTFDVGALNDSDKLNVVRKLSQNGVAPKSLSTNDIQNAVEQFANKGVSDIPAPILKNNFETDPQKRADIDSQNAKAIADYNAQISTVRTKNLQALGLATSEQQSQKSQAQGIVAGGISNANAKDTRAILENIHTNGYPNVTVGDIPKFQSAQTQRKIISNTSDAVDELLNDKNLNNYSTDEFGAKIGTLLNPIAAADDANGVNATEELKSVVRVDPSFGAIAKGSQTMKDFAENVVRTFASSQDRSRVLNQLKTMVNTMGQSGSAQSTLDIFAGKGQKRTAADDLEDKLLGGKNNPIPYTRGMKTIPGKYYNVNGSTIQSKGQ